MAGGSRPNDFATQTAFPSSSTTRSADCAAKFSTVSVTTRRSTHAQETATADTTRWLTSSMKRHRKRASSSPSQTPTDFPNEPASTNHRCADPRWRRRDPRSLGFRGHFLPNNAEPGRMRRLSRERSTTQLPQPPPTAPSDINFRLAQHISSSHHRDSAILRRVRVAATSDDSPSLPPLLPPSPLHFHCSNHFQDHSRRKQASTFIAQDALKITGGSCQISSSVSTLLEAIARRILLSRRICLSLGCGFARLWMETVGIPTTH